MLKTLLKNNNRVHVYMNVNEPDSLTSSDSYRQVGILTKSMNYNLLYLMIKV